MKLIRDAVRAVTCVHIFHCNKYDLVRDQLIMLIFSPATLLRMWAELGAPYLCEHCPHVCQCSPSGWTYGGTGGTGRASLPYGWGGASSGATGRGTSWSRWSRCMQAWKHLRGPLGAWVLSGRPTVWPLCPVGVGEALAKYNIQGIHLKGTKQNH